MRDGWKGEDERLIDATKLSADQNTSVDILRYLAGWRPAGLRSAPGWRGRAVHPHNEGKRAEGYYGCVAVRALFRSEPESGGQGLVLFALHAHEGTTVWLHTFGTPLDKDVKVFGGEYRGVKLGELDLIGAGVTDNRALPDRSRSAHGVPATRDDILVKDLRKTGSDFVPLIYGVDGHTQAANIGDRFFLMTDAQAPNGRIVEATPGGEPSQWKPVIAEGKNVIDSFSIVGGKMFVSRLKDVKTETTIYTLEGKQTGTLSYPGIGSGSVVYGRSSDTEGFYTFESFIRPETIYRYDTRPGSRRSSPSRRCHSIRRSTK